MILYCFWKGDSYTTIVLFEFSSYLNGIWAGEAPLESTNINRVSMFDYDAILGADA